MAEQNRLWTITVCALLPHREKHCAWVVNGAAGPALPTYTHSDAPRWRHDIEVQQRLEALLGIPLNLLRRWFQAEDEETRQREELWVLEAAGPQQTPATPGRWLPLSELHAIHYPERMRPTIERIRHELETGDVPPLRVSWVQSGWREELVAWLDEQLAAHGRQRLGRIEPLKMWELAAVLRIHTDQGPLYFKAVAEQPLFVNEGVILQKLAQLYPCNVPRPLMVDADRRWMLLPDVGSPMGWDASLEVQQGMLGAFAQIQMDAAGRVPELLAAGCLDRRLDVLAGQIEPLFNHPGVRAVLTGEELERLHELVPRLRESCARLAEAGVPETLAHGDLHGANVAHQDGRYLILDWTDACITHPFMDLINVHFHPQEAERPLLRDHYLSFWEAYAAPERLCEAWQLAQPLMFLHQAVSYRTILDHIEPGSGHSLGWGPPYWLRLVLKHYGT